MIKIDAIEAIVVDLPTIRPHVLSMATMRSQTAVIVRVSCADGVVGIGEATTIGGLSYGAESPEGIKLAIDLYIRPILLTCDALGPAQAMAKIADSIVGNHFAKSAVETALYDAYGRRSSMPVSEILGGRVHESLPVAWTLASADTARDIEEAEHMLEARRHNIFKLKIGKREMAEDVRHVAAIKRALGDRASVRVDLNQAWDEADAPRGLRMLEDAGTDLVEQPISRRNRAGMARLAARSPIPIMADEVLGGPDDAFDVAARAAAQVFAVKISPSGGLTAAQHVGAIADAAGIGLYGGTLLETGIGTIASAHVFSTFRKLAWGTELFAPLLLTENILTAPLAYSDFSLAVPSGPGLGIEIDEDKLAFFRRDRDAARSPQRNRGS